MSDQHHEEERSLAVGVIEIEIVEIEIYARERRPVPTGTHYRIRVDKEQFVVKQSTITGQEILALVHKTPQTHQLYQHIRSGQTKVVQPTERVDLTAPGVERFTTMKIENTQGKTVTIIVEGTPHEWPKGEITYAEVVTLEVPDFPQHPEITYSVTYERGHGNKPEGVLAPGSSVKVKEGMVFHVSPTGQS